MTELEARETAKIAIEKFILTADSFTFRDVVTAGSISIPDEFLYVAYRIADNALKKARRAGAVSPRKSGRDWIWSHSK